MGHGMMDHAKTMISKWGGGTCILSPRDMKIEQIERFSHEIHELNGKIAIDPQFYQPYSDHDKLTNHSFWPESFETSNFFSGSGISKMITDLLENYNLKTLSDIFIIPGRFTDVIDDDWKKYNDILITEVLKKNISTPVYMTLSLSSEVIYSEEMVHELLEHIEDWDVTGYYIVAQHPKDNYLIADASWLAGLIDLCAGIKLLNKKIIVGYANQQQLYLALAKVDAIATGTWLNVRAFSLDKFEKPEEDQQSRRSTWYYCPQALSEYQIPFMDIAKRSGIIDNLKAESLFDSNYADILFTGAQPTSVEFSEREAFRHYLQCLHVQTGLTQKNTFDETYLYLTQMFDAAGKLASYFKSRGVRAKYKDFSDVYEDTISALDLFKTTRGMIFKHKWNSL